MLLIEALYIDGGGGLMLLRYLADELEKRHMAPYYVIDERCGNAFEDIPSERKCIMVASFWARKQWYKENGHKFDKVLCFGNIPPSILLPNATCYTYFHNINMLKIPTQLPLKVKILSWIKRRVYIWLKRNTNFWIVQTENTKNELVKHLVENRERVKIVPFYNITGSSCKNSQRDGFVCASGYNPHKNFEFIVDAWSELAKRQITPVLHLTIGMGDAPEAMFEKIETAKKNGARIVNHGIMPQQELFSLYRQCRGLVYAAINESLGLCIIEAIENGCDVIAPELPYVHSICKPSGTFFQNNMDSFIEVISKYERGDCERTESTVRNQIEEMVGLLS